MIICLIIKHLNIIITNLLSFGELCSDCYCMILCSSFLPAKEFNFILYNNFRAEKSQLLMSVKDFQIVSKLGQGAYSTVYKAKRIEDNHLYALKRVKIMNLSPKEKQNALNEIRILASIRHPNIISYKEAFFDEPTKSLCIVMQYASEGDLSHKIIEHQKKGTHLGEQEIWSIFVQIVKGLGELHRLNIFHRDIKPANIFLAEGGIVKLGDMNVSKITERGFCMTQTGTPYYASPQVWKDEPYDEKSDIWSLGCVLYELIALKPPFKAEDMEGLFKKVTRGIYQRLPSEFSQELNAVIRSLLQVNPDVRPSCQKLLCMPQVLKKAKFSVYDEYQKTELLKTIRADNIYTIGDLLPKPNYVPLKIKKAKGIKSLIDSLEDKELCQVESLPSFDKGKKISPGEHSDRIISKDSKVSKMLRERKKSEVASSRSGLEINGVNYDSKDLKLPKVQNRYQKVKDRLSKQSSLKSHKPLEN